MFLWTPPLSFRHLILLVSAITITATSAQDAAAATATVTGFDVELLKTRLPKALSDFTVVSDSSTGKVYLQGGCDAVNGNVFNDTYKEFVCESLSLTSYVFDLNAQEFTETNPMPVARFRHAAVLVNNQIWLVGGRDPNDDVVTTVDVFAIDDGSWTTHDGLNEKYHVSDLTGFAGPDGLAYFVAGYDFNYTAQTTVFSIDPVASTANNTLVIQEQASLPTARGDASAVTAKDKESGDMYALVTGGFTDQNDFCDPLNTTERYDFTSGAWSDTNNLVVPRGDEALVVLNDRIYALGGERQYEARCYASPNDTPDPGEETVPIVDVEWYNETSDTWTVIEDLPRHRFRFAAIGYKNAIYSFGGQLAFDASCNCFRTSDEVIVYKEVTSDAVATSPALVACLYLTIAGLALWM